MYQQDSSRVRWKDAERPDYETNIDLKYPYSELPFVGQFRLKKLPFDGEVLEHVDYWGQGRITTSDGISGFPDVYNINSQFQIVSNGPDFESKIPNRIPVYDDEECDTSGYINDNSVRTVTVKASEINKSCAIDIARMINDENGRIILYGFPTNSVSFKNVSVTVNQKNIFFCPHYELPPEFQTITSDIFAAFLNFNDMKKIIYHNITNGKYNEAVEQMKWMGNNVLKYFANGLFLGKVPNTMSFAYQLWLSGGKDTIQYYFPRSLHLIFQSMFVLIVNKQYDQSITLEKDDHHDSGIAWGTFEYGHDTIWNMESAWENGAVIFEISNPNTMYYLGLDVNVDSYGDRQVIANSNRGADRFKFYLEPFLRDDGDAEYFIINKEYGQGLKLDVNTNGEGHRRVWGNKDDVHEMEILEKSKRFRWYFKG